MTFFRDELSTRSNFSPVSGPIMSKLSVYMSKGRESASSSNPVDAKQLHFHVLITISESQYVCFPYAPACVCLVC